MLASVSQYVRPEEFLDHLKNVSGLLLEKNPGIYSFAHPTFQEYLAAVYIKEQGLEASLIEQIENPWWHETIRLYCSQADATRIIQACLNSRPLSAVALALAFECDQEKLIVQPQAQEQLTAILETGCDDPDPEHRSVVAEALLTQRMHRMSYLREGTYIDSSLVTHAEYQLFLDEQRAQGNSSVYVPAHWKQDCFPAGAGKKPVLGVRRADAQKFCAWLTAREGEGWRYRLPCSDEWSLEERHRQSEVSNETGYWVEDKATLVWLHGEPADGLKQQLRVIVDRALVKNDRASTKELSLIEELAADLARTFIRAQSLIRDLGLSNNIVKAQHRDRAFLETFVSYLTQAINLSNELIQANAGVGRRSNEQVIDQNSISNLESIRTRARALAAVWNPRSRTFMGMQDRLAARAHELDRVRELCIMLLLLKERIEGYLPAYEGILLIKEHKNDEKP
ncbi:NACHT domain-containing protein [Dictyobacter kobayashii]|uniref:Sulfatase-modifying factor enzyme-like domain-containing protein n=1 Tax=Dictyobacter kobayashii TaxID=2014872 RepID=A0A402AEK0_9CHLR|nr:SUMF1/EgtB/PvdO family nonheme iron enzyme [Dictyobacter kobayashii]GCE17540.1 hypothetical protein KDK_13400 [Dictyobacter kobayashii]